jgi:YHS domain-containing protein
MAIRRFAALLAAVVPAALCASFLSGAAPEAKTERIGEPYTLSTCPVSGENLGSMGDPVVKVYEGREVRFCCASCVGAFEKDPAKYLANIDEMIIAQQMPYYPLKNCVVNPGDPLDIEGAHDVSVRYVHFNRLVRFCCDGCTGKFEKNPEKFLAVIDAAVIDAQTEDYPLTTCVISGEKLGGMGDTLDKVYANRLVRLCCAGCVEEFERDPAKYFRQIDAARKP